MDEMLTIKEVAVLLRVHRSTLYRMIKRGDIPHFKVGYDYRFTSESIERWVKGKTVEQWNPSESKSSGKPRLSEKR